MKPRARPAYRAGVSSAWSSRRPGVPRSNPLCGWRAPSRGIPAFRRARAFRGNEGADTGFLVAFGTRRDAHHRWAVNLASQVTEPLLTCEAVLAEACFHLGSVALVLAFVRDGLVRPAFDAASHLQRLFELARRYADRSPDLADLCLIRMSELYPKHPVITTDVDEFSVYRRGRREAIPLIHPPASR
jgi:uncharacterized protein